jgi:two-component system chemotaxis sensor kinase CheA
MDDGRRFDVIVTDVEMPEMDGYAFAEAIRGDQRWSHLPIIAVSAVCTPSSIERGRDVGFDDFVAKFDRPGLISAIKDVTNIELGVAA